MTELIRYDAACAAIARAKSVDEVREIHNRSEALRAYAKISRNRSMEVDAAEIRIRAERRLGEMLAEAKRCDLLAKGALLRGNARPLSRTKEKFTLREAGIDKKLSMRAQQTAAIEEPKFDKLLSDWRSRALDDTASRVVPTLVARSSPSPRARNKNDEDFKVWQRDIRQLRVGELIRIAERLGIIARHAGTANDHKLVGDVISDGKLRSLLKGDTL